MKISVCINTISRPLSLVERAVRSALSQVELQDEVVLVDQNSEKLVFPDDITTSKQFSHQHRIVPTVSLARNAASFDKSGNWIVFCDDDGFLGEGYLGKLRTLLNESPELDVVAGSILREDTHDFYSMRQKIAHEFKGFTSTKLLMGSNFSVRKSVFETVGKFDERFGAGSKAGSSEETDFCWKAYFAGKKIAYRPDLIVYHVPPFQEEKDLAFKKSWKYGVGKGLLVRKWLFEKKQPLVLLELAEMFVVPFAQVAIGILKFNSNKISAAFASFCGRLVGFFFEKLDPSKT